MANMLAYPGRTFGQLYHRFLGATTSPTGTISSAGARSISPTCACRCSSVAGEGDGIAPQEAVHQVVDLLPGAPEVRLETAPGGHLGVLTGRAARRTTWVFLDEFLSEGDARAGDELPAQAA